MKLRKFIHEHIFDIVNDSTGDINAAQQFLNDVEGSEKFNFGDVDIDFNNHTISIEIQSIHEEFPFYAILDIEFDLNSYGSYTPAVIGTSDLSSPSEGESVEWDMKLKSVKIMSVDMGDVVYDGKELFLDFFNKYSDSFKEYLQDEIDEKFVGSEPDYDLDETKIYENISLKEFINEEIKKIHTKTLLESKKQNIEKQLKVLNESDLKLASGNPLDGKVKQSAINYIYKIYNQLDHGQRYKDDAWQNVHKIFNLFSDYRIDTDGGYDAEYNPGGMNVDSTTQQWKKWNLDFRFIDKKGIPRTITFVLKAMAAGSVEEPWGSYDLVFYPIN